MGVDGLSCLRFSRIFFLIFDRIGLKVGCEGTTSSMRKRLKRHPKKKKPKQLDGELSP